MELYKAPRRSLITVPGMTAASEPDCVLFFDHIDGAYSVCYTSSGQVVHIRASSEVEVVDFGGRITAVESTG